MGDPKKPKKKYSTPSHPWNRNRINNEKIIIKQYGLNNKKEIWKTNSKISNFAAIAKRLIRERRSEQAKQETENFLTKLFISTLSFSLTYSIASIMLSGLASFIILPNKTSFQAW